MRTLLRRASLAISALALTAAGVQAEPRLCLDYSNFVHYAAQLQSLGELVDITVAGNVAYCALESGDLRTVDVTDPAAPVVLGSLDYAGLGIGLEYYEGHVYLSNTFIGLAVIDVSDPANPTEVTTTSGGAKDMHADASLLYSANGSLVVVNISNPALAAPIFTLPGAGDQLEIDGAYAYMGDGFTVRVIALSPLPNEVATVGVRAAVSDMTLDGDFLYVTENDGISVLDVTDPLNPAVVATVDQVNGFDSVERYGDWLLLADSLWTHVMDISDPLNPMFVGYLYTFQMEGMAQANDHALFATRFGGLLVADFSRQELAPPLAAAVPPHSGGPIAVQGSTLVQLGGIGSGVMSLFDVSDPLNPRYVTTRQVSDRAVDLRILGNHAVIVDDHADLEIWDITTAQLATQVSTLAIDGWFGPWEDEITLEGTTAYINDALGFHIIELEKPAEPAYVGGWSLGTWFISFAKAGDYGYIGDFEEELHVVDLSDPTNPQLATTLPIGRPWDLTVVGDYLYSASTTDSQLTVIDISDPLSPSIANSLDMDVTWGSTRSLLIENTLVFDGTSGLQFIDVSDPGQPIVLPELLPAASEPVLGDDLMFARGGGGFVTVPNRCQDAMVVPSNAHGPLQIDRDLGRLAVRPAIPNPFNPRTQLRFHLGEPGVVQLRIMDARGRHVRRVTHAYSRGWHEWIWDGTDELGSAVASGVYRFSVESHGEVASRPVTLIR